MPRSRRAPGGLERRGNSFRIYLCVGGERHRFTVRTKDHRVAEDVARAKYDELEKRMARRQAGLPTSVRMSQLLDHFKQDVQPTLTPGTQKAYGYSLVPIRAYFVEERGDLLLESIRAAHIQEYLAWRRVHRGQTNAKRPQALHNRTLAKDRAVLHRLFAIAEKMEWRDGNPVARTEAPKSDRREPVILSPEQYDRLVTACQDDRFRPSLLALYVITLAETGARSKSEALWLQWDDINFEQEGVWIAGRRGEHRNKTGKGHWAAMTPRLKQAMQDHFRQYRFNQYKGQPTPWVFHHPDSRWGHHAGERIGDMYNGVKAAARRAKLPSSFVVHDLRHTRITSWLADGESAVMVQQAVGHSDLKTTMGYYSHVPGGHLATLNKSTALAVQRPRSRADKSR